jgi:6,7-dimethyl-8-ribityllumazine synthase
VAVRNVTTYEIELDGRGLRVGVLASRFNHPITRRLLDACEMRLAELGVDSVEVAWVPGAFELPLAARAAAESGRYDALITLGVVIRGGTPHFDYVCRGVTDGVAEVSRSTRLPIAFGVLTTDDVEQALARAVRPGEPGANKGAEAAEVAIEMARLLARMEKAP